MAAEDSDIQLAEPIGSGSHQAGDPDAPATAGGTPVLIHLLAPLVYVLACAVLLVADLSVTDGTFTYVLDDAYIHLSLAENVAQGHYGLNPDEPASPSSSVLWPLVLAPFAGAEGFDRIPLVLNLICCVLFLIALQRFLFFLAGPSSDRARAGIAVLVACLVFAFNLPGLTFTGMEHPIQILCAAGVVAGL